MTATGVRYLSGFIAAVLVLAGTAFAFTDHAEGADRAQAQGYVEDLAFVVHHVDTTDVIADPEYPSDNVTADGRFVVVKLTVINTSAQPQVFHSALSTLSEGAAQYEVESAAWHYVGDADKPVAAGESIEAALVFDVPRAASPRAIVLRDAPSSTGVTIVL